MGHITLGEATSFRDVNYIHMLFIHIKPIILEDNKSEPILVITII